ncbi:NADPH-dependent FMN reductase [Alkalicoccus chagannorensis]|uniref:NADPH-dependent FMN reductase n=1 Tax=Alkalicoccus chagannorensis TaxID=427072 RepID=UPI000407AE44|nr:NADPH-dependent FMN reductase [Alkalicoccus chagannorensis]
MNLVGIAGTITGSKPETIIEEALERAEKLDPSISTTTINLKELQLPFCDGRPESAYPAEVHELISTIAEADAVILATPVFQASIPGALKNMFDLLPVDILAGKPAGCIACSGTYHHFLVIENQLKPILSYLKAYSLPSYVYLHRDDFEGTTIVNKDSSKRVDQMIEELLALATRLPAGVRS